MLPNAGDKVPDRPPEHPRFAEALRFWLRLGFIGFGGPAGQIALLHDFLVARKRWISERRFLHALQYCMLLPGPEAQQLATYTGWLLHGARGGLAAGILFVLPSALMLWGLSYIYVQYGTLPAVQAVFALLKPAVLAIVIEAVFKIGKKSLHGPLYYAVAGVAFVAISQFGVPFPLLIVSALLLGWGAWRFFPGHLRSGPSKTVDGEADEAAYLLNSDTPPAGGGFSLRRLALQLGTALLLWGAAWWALRWWAPGDFAFWRQIALFFTKAALVTFGGAYAVLPYVAQAGVEQFHWLDRAQMIDGLALGETTPGPLIMVLAFVGFMAGYNTSGGSLFAATTGLTATVFYTFLPSFFFIFAGAPIVESTRMHTGIRHIMGVAGAAVTGVVCHLAFYFGRSVLLPPDVWIWAWALLSLFALLRLRVNMILWIGISALAGICRHYLGA